ncbi:MAG: transglutaminase-like domain-containing protein, partial [Ruminococcus sp.]|nr:transglutaminase-like domain-containing protein [Ruminococcus sp.]
NKIVGDYNLTEDGSAVPLSAVQNRAKAIISSTGTDATAIYNYVRNNNKYSLIESTRSLSQIESVGWSYFANYALDNRFVVCYYFAAVTDLLYKQAGYQTRIVYGTGHYTSEHYWNQVYVNGTWLNYDACNGYCGVSDAVLKSKNYTWYQNVYPKYY